MLNILVKLLLLEPYLNQYNSLMRILSFLILLMPLSVAAQHNYWQQKVAYKMDVNLDVTTHKMVGTQELKYYNNSPDTLHQVFYHLYFNAFQPGSMMDVRSRSLPDPDRRVGSRIAALDEHQIGYQKIISLKQNGKNLKYSDVHTILEVKLEKPILPGANAVFTMEFEAQVPIQIRRSGRQNFEGIAYSMAQWYPKMCEYDKDGWHTEPYIAREFYGVWGNFEVNITIDKDYIIGGTGVLQNPCEIGFGYCDESKTTKPSSNTLTWKFKANNVHDFVWAADPDFVHKTAQVPNGPLLHFLYQESDTLTKHWSELPEKIVEAVAFFDNHFGKYPYPQYSVIQGGDGGMEYPMATLITGRRKIGSLVGVTLHEMAHSWYQMMLATNETKYAWMDEGFTSYASNLAFRKVMWDNKATKPFSGSMNSYRSVVEAGLEEPLTTHADWFNTNRAYGMAAYSKGELFLVQLEYIVGTELLNKAMLKYYDLWAFKHPTPSDFIRIVEKVSNIQLDWFLNSWVETTRTIDYSIAKVEGKKKETTITLQNKGGIPMPIEIEVTQKNGKSQLYYIPITLMRGEKKMDDAILLEDWAWTHPTYELKLDLKADKIAKIIIDPSGRMADIKPDNNSLIIEDELDFLIINQQ